MHWPKRLIPPPRLSLLFLGQNFRFKSIAAVLAAITNADRHKITSRITSRTPYYPDGSQ
jgi:hypothetical protein